MTLKKPNLLFVFADQWRRDAVGFRNKEPVHTPSIDRFAAESLVFEQAISCFPLCSPNRSSILTGRFPLSTGVTTNCKLGLSVQLNDDEPGFGTALKEAGYRTGYIGKWHLEEPDQNKDASPASGASHWDAYTPPGPRRLGFDFWYSYGAYDQHMAPHYWMDSPELIQINEWSLKHETDIAESFIRQRDKDLPFALFVSWNPPHQPFDQVPDQYRAHYKDHTVKLAPNMHGEGIAQTEQHLLDYYAAITGMDEQFARLMTLLKEEGIADDTLVVLTSDHGEMMGAHNWLEHKNIWYEESIGVPLMMRWPQRIDAGQQSVLFNSVDLLPTVLGLLNIAIPKQVEGTDLSQAAIGQQEIKRESVFICHYPGAIDEHRLALEQGLDINAYGWRGVRTPHHTYVVQRQFSSNTLVRLLYDLEADPYQMSPYRIEGDLADSNSEQFELQLLNWLEQIDDPFRFALL